MNFVKVNIITKECICLVEKSAKEIGFEFIENTPERKLLVGNLRKHDPCKGYIWDEELDVFIPQKPGENFTFNTETKNWQAKK